MDDLQKTKAELIEELATLRKELKQALELSASPGQENNSNDLEDHFRWAQRMEAIAALAGGIAHELNNILSPIMLHTEMAMLDIPSENPVQTNLREVYQAGERGRELATQIQALGGLEEDEPYPLKVSLIVKLSLKLFRASLPATITLRPRIDTESDTVLADPTQVYQVLWNLYSNARDAMDEGGGELTVSLDSLHLGPETAWQSSDLDPGFYVRLSIRDTGHGMSAAVMDRIFEPRFTTKESGSGLGLPLVRDIVKSHRGEICVDSAPGKGTTFEVLLPMFGSGRPS